MPAQCCAILLVLDLSRSPMHQRDTGTGRPLGTPMYRLEACAVEVGGERLQVRTELFTAL